ncbi:MAG: diguanylate cyclase [Chitinivorax sp.]
MKPDQPAPSGTQPRILIVDDTVTNIRVLSHILHKQGEIFFATSGQAAIAMARDKLPDLILLDVEMPGMDGYETCRILKADPLLALSPVIFVTGHSGTENELRALAAGGVDFISKPLNPPVVSARVKTHLTLKRQTDLLREQANLDGLTGIANRRIFDVKLDEECRRHRRYGVPLALAMIDVDRFKQYNDLYGHQEGDACLRQVAQTIHDCARRPGEIAARYGGEEFAVILPATALGAAYKFGAMLCQKIRNLALPHRGAPEGGIVTISVGVASLQPQDDEAGQNLVAAADMALYLAKSSGRNRVVAEALHTAE